MNHQVPQHATDHNLYDIPSGMGGTFTVRVLEAVDENRVHVQIWMPRNPDFHKHTLVTAKEALKPVRPAPPGR